MSSILVNLWTECPSLIGLAIVRVIAERRYWRISNIVAAPLLLIAAFGPEYCHKCPPPSDIVVTFRLFLCTKYLGMHMR